MVTLREKFMWKCKWGSIYLYKLENIGPERGFYLDKVYFQLDVVMKIHQSVVLPTKTWIISKMLIS